MRRKPPAARFRVQLARLCVLSAASLVGLLATTSCSRSPRPNIVVILIDTLRADHLGSYGYARDTSPNLDRLAAQGMRFETALSVASYTRAATGSLFTGLYPSIHGSVAYGESLSDGVVTLAQLLSDSGYETVAFHLNDNIDARFGFSRGFEHYEHPGGEFRAGPGQDPNRFSWIATDDAIPWKAIPFIEGPHERPFFLYLHFVGPHSPYSPPPDAISFVDGPLTLVAQRFFDEPELGPGGKPVDLISGMELGYVPVDEATKTQIVDLYDGEIAFTDRQVQTVLDALRENGLGDETVVIVTSDHGEELWDHGGVSHGTTHFQELLRIPLMVSGPGIRAGTVSTPVSLIDVMPTVLELAGLKPSADLPGRSLLPVLHGNQDEPEARPLYAEGLLRFDGAGVPLNFYRSIQNGPLKLILNGRKHEKLLFDLEGDPKEEQNLLEGPRRKEGRALMRELIEIHSRNLSSPSLGATPSVGRVEMDAELEANLRALGYVGGESEAASQPAFRAPLRFIDMEPYGFLGSEESSSQYLSRLDFSTDAFSGAGQLLYGWQKRPNEPAVLMSRTAGVRLKRDAGHTTWRIQGFIPVPTEPGSPMELQIRLDGAETRHETIATEGVFDVSGPLPRTERPFLRLDVSCSGSPLAVHHGALDETAPCLFVSAIAVE